MKMPHIAKSGAALALLAVALGVGTASRADDDADDMGWQHRQGMSAGRQAILATVPADRLALFKNMLASVKSQTQDMRSRIEYLKEQASQMLEAPAFDRDAFLDNQEQIRHLTAQIQRIRAEAVASIAGRFTPDQRDALGGGLSGEALSHPHHRCDEPPQ